MRDYEIHSDALPTIIIHFVAAVTWLKYCRYGVKLHPIKSINIHLFCVEKLKITLNHTFFV